MQENDFFSTDLKIVCGRLSSSASGLTPEEEEKRLRQYGPNTLKETPGPSLWDMFVEEFKSPLVILLVVAAINIHHFVVDRGIWRLRGDARNRVVVADALPVLA